MTGGNKWEILFREVGAADLGISVCTVMRVKFTHIFFIKF